MKYLGYTDLWEVLSSDVNPGTQKDKARDLCTWRGRKVVDLKKNVDKNPLYNPIDGKELQIYQPPSDDHQILATAVITAPDSIPELYTSSKRLSSPTSEPEAKRVKEAAL